MKHIKRHPNVTIDVRDATDALQSVRDSACRMVGRAFLARLAGDLTAAEHDAHLQQVIAAVQPFAAAARGMAELDLPDDAAVLRASADWHLRSGEGRPLTVGDFRRLDAALSALASRDPLTLERETAA